MHGNLAGLCAEHVAAHAHEVAYVEELFEHGVVQLFVVAGAYLVARHVHLHAAVAVLQFHEGCFSHDSAGHYASCHAHLARLGFVAEVGADVVAVCVHRIFGCGIGVDAHLAHCFHAAAAYYFLFAEFQGVHISYYIYCRYILQHKITKNLWNNREKRLKCH